MLKKPSISMSTRFLSAHRLSSRRSSLLFLVCLTHLVSRSSWSIPCSSLLSILHRRSVAGRDGALLRLPRAPDIHENFIAGVFTAGIRRHPSWHGARGQGNDQRRDAYRLRRPWRASAALRRSV